MSAYVRVVSPGAYASIQDAGRIGFRRIGVPWSGVLDRRLMRIANHLVGNEETAPVIECFDGGQQFAAADASLRIALAGNAVLEVEDDAGRRQIAPWHSFILEPGQALRITRISPGRIGVLAVSGMTVPAVMASASTYARAALGGLHGRALQAGDEISASAATAGAGRMLAQAPEPTVGAIRVVAGPQRNHFDSSFWSIFTSSDYKVSPAADRMGVRLEGPPLRHLARYGHEIVSDATVPGSIQIPGNGLPVVLLADAQTAGGYPKIATVISADLARVAASPPGSTIRFTAVGAHEGEQIARDEERLTRALLEAIRTVPGEGVDLDALYSGNLVDGVVNALSPEQSR